MGGGARDAAGGANWDDATSTASSAPAARDVVGSRGHDGPVDDHDPVAEEIVDQLVEQLADRLRALAAGIVPGPSCSPGGADPVRAAAVRVARRLRAEEPSGAAAAMQVVHALWADGSPPAGWWRTPLGRALAACGAGDPAGGPYRSRR